MTESLAVPPGTPAPSRHPDAPAPGTLLPPPPPHSAFCYGCGDRNAAGLHVRVTAGEGVRVTAQFNVDELHEGAPGLAHGGVLAAALDEVLGETSMEGWGGGLRFGWLVGSFVLLVPLFVSLTPPFWLCVR